MSARAIVLGALAIAWLVPAVAAAQRRVAVEVVDVTADRAYLRPGESAGVGIGARVQIGRQAFRVIGATASYAVIGTGDERVEVGARGQARRLAGGSSDEDDRREVPRPPESYRALWPEVTVPSATQTPEPIPLGRAGTRGPTRLELALSAAMAVYVPTDDRGAALGRGEIRARMRARPFDGVPLSLLADVAAQLWYAEDLGERQGGSSRPWVRVRELQLVYGEGADLRAAIGRMRQAASMLGALDGASVRTPSMEGFTLGAFGGFLPNPLDQSPDFETARFGAELGYRNVSDFWRPSFDLVAHGSYFDGSIDERRLQAQAQVFPGDTRLGAHVELSLHDEINPWSAPIVEVSAAGIDGSVRAGPFEIGARFDRRLPERSRWLARWLPSTWLCAPSLEAGADPSACAHRDDARWSGTLDLGVRWDQGFVRAGGTVIHHPSDPQLSQLAGFAVARVVRVLEWLHGDLGVFAATGSLLDTISGNASLGLALPDDVLDVSVRYRIAYSIDRADVRGWLEHQIGGALLVSPIDDLSLWLEIDGITGREVEAIVGQLAASWRLRL